MGISLESKIAKMLMVGFDGYKISENPYVVKAISEHGLGGVMLYDLETDEYKLKNIRSPEQVKELTDDLKSISDTGLFIGIDHEGGQVNRLKPEYGFPDTYSHKYLGDLNDMNITFNQSTKMAHTLSKLGININFAPVVDLNTNIDNPVIAKKERSFSDHPGVVTAHAREFIRAHTMLGINCVIKHFPGHGSSSGDSHLEFVDITDTWSEKELEPYTTLIREGHASCVMTAHVVNRNIDPEYPATLSSKFINEIIRDKIRFDGLVFSDDLNMDAIKNHYELDTAIERAITSGVDIVLMSFSGLSEDKLLERFIDIVKKIIDGGQISENRIDESYKRISNLYSTKLITG